MLSGYFLYILLILASLFSGILVTKIYEFLFNYVWPTTRVHIFGLHFHHSNYSIILFILAFFIQSNIYKLIIISFSIGILIQHTFSEKKLIFVERIK